jgi:small subunit ribosomal protein S1
LIHLSELSQERVTDPEEVVQVGQELDAKIIKIDAENRKIGLSVRAFVEESEQREVSQLNNPSSTNATIGDMAPESMSGLRSALEDAVRREEEGQDN